MWKEGSKKPCNKQDNVDPAGCYRRIKPFSLRFASGSWRAALAVEVQETGMKDLERRREPSAAKINGKDTELSEENVVTSVD